MYKVREWKYSQDVSVMRWEKNCSRARNQWTLALWSPLQEEVAGSLLRKHLEIQGYRSGIRAESVAENGVPSEVGASPKTC